MPKQTKCERELEKTKQQLEQCIRDYSALLSEHRATLWKMHALEKQIFELTKGNQQ